MRIIADHLRTAVMLIGDEKRLLPSNEKAGYVLRRLIRRAIRHGRNISLKTEDFIKVASIYIDDIYDDSYPLLAKNRGFILAELEKEINKFEATIENGLKEYKKILSSTKASNATVITGKDAFRLYDTFGFPLELTVEMAEEEGISVDIEGFETSLEEAKEIARNNANFSQKTSNDVFENLDKAIVSEFIGYDKLEAEDEVLALADSESLVNELTDGTEGVIIVSKTPFYATMGGQKGDIGKIVTETGVFNVDEAVKLPEGRIGHVGKVASGKISLGSKAKLSVCPSNRVATCKNHSATHLLQKALREVLGDGVEQQGSYQDAGRTRFDFSYGTSMSSDEIARVEKIVNEKIAANLSVTTDVMSIEEAKKTGAMALFGEKYGETVRVVSMGDFSVELCGGTHVQNTGDIANFKILSESGVAAGVRRIEAITGVNVLEYYAKRDEELVAAAAAAKTTPYELVKKIESMQKQIKELSSEVENLKAKAAQSAMGDVMNQVTEVKGVKLLATSVDGVDMNGLRDLGDQLKNKLGEGVVVIASNADGKVNLIAMATDEAMKKGAHAGNLIKGVAALVGGGGGGRPNMAQAGGKNPAGIDSCIKECEKVLESQIK